MKPMFKDAGNHSYFWSVLGGVFAWLADYQNLMLVSLVVAIVTSIVNLYAKCQEGKAREKAEAREQELHDLKVKQLKRGLRDE